MHFDYAARDFAIAQTGIQSASRATLAVQANAEKPVARVALTAIDDRRLYCPLESRLIVDRVVLDHVVPDEFGHRRHHGHDDFTAGERNRFICVGSSVVPYGSVHTEGAIGDSPIFKRLLSQRKGRSLVNGCDKRHSQLSILGRCLTNLADNGAREISECQIDVVRFEAAGSNFGNGTVLLVKVSEPYFHTRSQPAIVYGYRYYSACAFLKFANN
tara:strand:- start:553 stop:1197 length:645 start_codon:yes stop_codon:yes gene_type:complete